MRQADIERLLPNVVQRTATAGSPLDALLAVMEAMHAPAEAALAGLGDTFHPYRCPERFVPYLAGWVDLDRFLSDDGDGTMGLSSGLGPLREVVAAAARLARRRGTAGGLVELLELATGVRGFAVEEEVRNAAGEVRPFVVRVRVPAAAMRHRDLVERIIEAEKPAHVRCDIVLPAAAATTSLGGGVKLVVGGVVAVVVLLFLVAVGVAARDDDRPAGDPAGSALVFFEDLFPPANSTATTRDAGGATCVQGDTLVVARATGVPVHVADAVQRIALRRIVGSGQVLVEVVPPGGGLVQTVDTATAGPDADDPDAYRLAVIDDRAR